MSDGFQKWQEFDQLYQVEKNIYDLTKQAVQILQEKLQGKVISALCPMSYEGALSIAYNVYDGHCTGTVLKEDEYYPPDWTDEVDPVLCELFRESFEKPIGKKIQEMQDNHKDDAFCEDFREGYLQSVRQALVRLEKENVFRGFQTTDDFWLLVTEIDADTEDEERKLNQLRRNWMKQGK